MGKTIDGITRTASALTGTERFALRDGTPDPTDPLDAKATINQLPPYVFGEIDSLTEQTVAEDANLVPILDGTTPKYMSLTTLSTYMQNLIATQRRGTIQLWGAAAAPTGALLCDGQAVSRTTYAALFAIYGTVFGAGDGSTTFNVPNFQGVVPKGTGSQTINTRSKSGPILGSVEEDQAQLLTGTFNLTKRPSGSSTSQAQTGAFTTSDVTVSSYSVGDISATNTIIAQQLSFSSANSPDARTGATTRENCLGINFIIWY